MSAWARWPEVVQARVQPMACSQARRLPRFAAWAANSAAGLGTGGGAGCTIPDAVGATCGAEKPPGTNAGAVALGTKDCAPTLRPPLGLGTKVLAPGRKTKELAVALSFVDLVDFAASSPPSDMSLSAPVCNICVHSLRCPAEEVRTRSTSEVLLCKRWPRAAEDPGGMRGRSAYDFVAHCEWPAWHLWSSDYHMDCRTSHLSNSVVSVLCIVLLLTAYLVSLQGWSTAPYRTVEGR